MHVAAEGARGIVGSTNGNAKDSAAIVADTVEAMAQISQFRLRSIRSSQSSTRSRFRPICWRSTPGSRRRARARRARASQSWLPKCARWRFARRKRPRRSRNSSRPRVLRWRTASSWWGRPANSPDKIVAEVLRINEIVAEIAKGAKEQLIRVAEVNEAVGRMDRVTQENAAMVEKSSAATRALNQEAERLADCVARFKIEAGDGPAQRKAARAA